MFAFHKAAMKRFRNHDLRKAKAKMKDEALRLFIFAVNDERYREARKYLWEYMNLPPRRYGIPVGQKRNVAKALMGSSPFCGRLCQHAARES